MTAQFTLAEELTLVGLSNKNILKLDYNSYKTAFSIATVFIDLLLKNNLQMADDGTITVLNDEPVGISYVDQVLHTVATANKERTLKRWIIKLFNRGKSANELHANILHSLVEKNAATVEESKVLFVFSKKEYHANSAVLEQVVSRVRTEILVNESYEQQTVALCAILNETKLLSALFEKEELEQLKNKLKELKESDSFHWVKMVDRAINEIDTTALLVTVAATSSGE